MAYNMVIGGDCKHGRRPELCKECHPKMNWMLTDEEKKPLAKKYVASKLDGLLLAFDVLLNEVAQAQAKKLVEYYEGRCFTEHEHLLSRTRVFCKLCRQELRRQVGL